MSWLSGMRGATLCTDACFPLMNGLWLITLVSVLQYNQDLTLHEGNWKRLLLTALMIAQKTWDDRALMNKDFPVVSDQAVPASQTASRSKAMLDLGL